MVEKSRHIFDLMGEEVFRNTAIGALRATCWAQVDESDPSRDLDAGMAIDALSFVIALGVEADPAVRSPTDIANAARQIGLNIGDMVRTLREHSDQHGLHMLDALSHPPSTMN